MSMTMNPRKFLERYSYALESDFVSPSGEPATWAPGHPRRWGQERAKFQVDGQASTPDLSPDGKFLAVGMDRDIHIFDVATQELIDVLKGHLGDVERVVFAAAGAGEMQKGITYKLASQGSEEQGDSEGQMIILWDLDERGKLVCPEQRKPVDLDALATKTLQPLVSTLVDDHGWDASERAIGSVEEALRDALCNAVVTHEREGKICFDGEFASFESPVFSPDHTTLVYISQNNNTPSEPCEAELLPCVNLWDMETKSLRHRLSGHTDAIMRIAFNADGTLVASIAWDGTARVWDVGSGVCLHVLGPLDGQLWCGVFSPDSRYLAISQGSPDTIVHVYEIDSEKPVSRFDAFRAWSRSLAWSPDGGMLAGGGDDGMLCLWDPYTGEECQRWRLAFADPIMRSMASLRGVQFVDGARKLLFQIADGTVEVYDFERNLKQQFTRGPEDRIGGFPLAEMVCSVDSRLMVVPDADGSLRVWDL
ncbi:hypothetical protein N7492_006255 [Penicillium capsulatum]|uniref:Anaphase-promoting complex subunit 4 WD40 domain-containing protein n=1 Tax=Penicillium capsulatum TaxID=69766 RepID=A0A9W9I134_9EURO|nr:hypothetical protein N7492_006255 [Penicillium capsulatum]KAJ6108907.1 hypothetical protein N7512_008744 [Penicillium capsulatum]